jgi:hypothetical protein
LIANGKDDFKRGDPPPSFQLKRPRTDEIQQAASHRKKKKKKKRKKIKQAEDDQPSHKNQKER